MHAPVLPSSTAVTPCLPPTVEFCHVLCCCSCLADFCELGKLFMEPPNGPRTPGAFSQQVCVPPSSPPTNWCWRLQHADRHGTPSPAVCAAVDPSHTSLLLALPVCLPQDVERLKAAFARPGSLAASLAY
jgi:hypothetical protein